MQISGRGTTAEKRNIFKPRGGERSSTPNCGGWGGHRNHQGWGLLWQSWWAGGPRASRVVDCTVRWLNPRTSSPGNLPGCGIFHVEICVHVGQVSQPSRQIYDFGVLAPWWCGACLLPPTSSNLSLLRLTPSTSLPSLPHDSLAPPSPPPLHALNAPSVPPGPLHP